MASALSGVAGKGQAHMILGPIILISLISSPHPHPMEHFLTSPGEVSKW